MIKLLLTSTGISNKTMRDTLEQLLGKSISESKALFVPTDPRAGSGTPLTVENVVFNTVDGEITKSLI